MYQFTEVKPLILAIFITANFFTTSIVFAQMYQFNFNSGSIQQNISLQSNYLGTNTAVVKRVDCINLKGYFSHQVSHHVLFEYVIISNE